MLILIFFLKFNGSAICQGVVLHLKIYGLQSYSILVWLLFNNIARLFLGLENAV